MVVSNNDNGAHASYNKKKKIVNIIFIGDSRTWITLNLITKGVLHATPYYMRLGVLLVFIVVPFLHFLTSVFVLCHDSNTLATFYLFYHDYNLNHRLTVI